MPSRLFLQDAANSLTGTFPTVEQSAVLTATCAAPTANTLRTMRSLTGTSQVVRSITSSATTVAQVGFCAMFCSDTLNVNQVIPPQILTFNIANRESSASMNIGSDMRINAYVWRPSTGTKVGTLVDGLVMAGDVEPGAALSIRVNHATITSTVTLSADAGDVLVCELWNLFTQSVGTALQCGLYWGGTTVNTTPNAVVTNHASFFELGTTSLTFGTPAASSISGAASLTLSDVALVGTGLITAPGFVANGALGATSWAVLSGTWDDQTLNWDQFDGAILAAAVLAATGTSPRNGAYSNTLDALTLAATGTAGTAAANGTFSNTLAALTLAATGTSPRNGAFSNTLDAATLAGTGTSPRNGAFGGTLGALTLAGSGSLPLNATFSNTLGAATLAGTGASPRNGSFSNTLGAATLAGNATVPVVGAYNNTLGAATLTASGATPLQGSYAATLGDLSLGATGTVTDISPATGQFLNTLTNLQLAAAGTVLTPVPPAAQQDPGAGSGASRQRKKFRIPDTVVAPNPIDAILEPLPTPEQVVQAPKVATMSMVTHLAIAPAPIRPPFIRQPAVEEDEYSDDDLIMLAMLV